MVKVDWHRTCQSTFDGIFRAFQHNLGCYGVSTELAQLAQRNALFFVHLYCKGLNSTIQDSMFRDVKSVPRFVSFSFLSYCNREFWQNIKPRVEVCIVWFSLVFGCSVYKEMMSCDEFTVEQQGFLGLCSLVKGISKSCIDFVSNCIFVFFLGCSGTVTITAQHLVYSPSLSTSVSSSDRQIQHKKK